MDCRNPRTNDDPERRRDGTPIKSLSPNEEKKLKARNRVVDSGRIVCGSPQAVRPIDRSIRTTVNRSAQGMHLREVGEARLDAYKTVTSN